MDTIWPAKVDPGVQCPDCVAAGYVRHGLEDGEFGGGVGDDVCGAGAGWSDVLRAG